MMTVAQISYDSEWDRLLWMGDAISCGHCMKVLLVDGNGEAEWRVVSFEVNDSAGWYMPQVAGISPVGLFACEV